MSSLRVGDPFPVVDLIDHDGRPWTTAAPGRPLVLVLHRHLA